MISPAGFRDLISGRRTGPMADLARGVLRCIEVPYALAVRARNTHYDRRPTRVRRVPVPVISVGNLTLGGTGKTPFVEWLARWYAERGVRVALVSRGYRSEGAANDEALELAEKLPDVPHLQNADRVAAAQQAIREHRSQLLLLDDGFQHRRLSRDLDIVLIDALEPFGYGHVFPRGMLREPLSGLQRAHIVALSRADAVDDHARESIRARVAPWTESASWVEVAHQPRAVLGASGERRPIEFLAGRRVAAFCGIGNPAGFRHTLEACGSTVVHFREFADHHRYTDRELDLLAAEVTGLDDLAAVVCTHKDLVKIRREQLGNVPLVALIVDLVILSGKHALESALTRLLPIASG